MRVMIPLTAVTMVAARLQVRVDHLPVVHPRSLISGRMTARPWVASCYHPVHAILNVIRMMTVKILQEPALVMEH